MSTSAERPGTAAGDDVPVVALVCSAGGLEALVSVLSGLPADLPAAVVALQHQPPDHASRLADILGARCSLPVRAAVHGDPMLRGHVLVVPPGKHALATVDGPLALIDSGSAPPSRPSADLLLTSLAVTAGTRTIAVVLSGGGHDGATGATAVHDFGGIVICADEASSLHFSMPAATIARDDAADYVLPVTEIPAQLEMLLAARATRDEGAVTPRRAAP
jgi:two-component system, chemotaxis family, protein-glutamate methylesterase/glutaminase